MENNFSEIWKRIPNSTYAVSTHGRVKRLAFQKRHNINKTFFMTKEAVLALSNNNSKKYWRITIYYIGKPKVCESVHRLVAQAFIPNINNAPCINHIDGNKDNNHYSNLEWCTNQQNMNHRYEVLKSFSSPTGDKSVLSKLKEDQVRQIPILLEQGLTKTAIGKLFGVGATTITEITSGRSWSYLGLFQYKQRKSEKYNKAELGLRYSPILTET